MSHVCVIDAAVLEQTTIGAAVVESIELAAALEEREELGAALSDRTALSAGLGPRTLLAAAAGAAEQLAAALDSRRALEVEMDDMAILSGPDREKLDSVDWGARRYQPDFVKLAYASEKSTGGGGEAGGGSGDSTQWVGSDAYLETVRFLVPWPSWRGNGYIEWDFTAAFANPDPPATGAETVTFELQRAAAPPTTPGTDPAQFGLPQAWTSVATFTSLAIPAGAGTGLLTFLLRIRAGGHQGTTWRQTWSGEMTWSDLSGGEPRTRAFIARTAMDVTNDLLLRMRFKTDYALGTGQSFNVTSASAIFACPRDGHSY